MNFKKLRRLVVAGSLAFAGAASANIYFTGSLSVSNSYGGGSAGGGTLTLFPTALITKETGTFPALVPAHSDLTAYSATISGIGFDFGGSGPTTENINDYLSFSTPDAAFGSSGTTPNNRFEFNLATLQQLFGGQPNTFEGTGTLVDTEGVYANTPGLMTVSFSGPDFPVPFSFTLAAVPEPATISLVATGLLGALAKGKPLKRLRSRYRDHTPG